MPPDGFLGHEMADVEPPFDPKPRGVRLVAARLSDREVAREQPTPAGCVQEPLAFERATVAEIDAVWIAELERGDADALEQVDAVVIAHRAQIVFEPSAIDLKGRHERKLRRADLRAILERVRRATFGEVAEPILDEMSFVQVVR